MTGDPLRLSTSSVTEFARCPRLFAHNHIDRRERWGATSRPLAFGRAGHKGQEALWRWEGAPADPGRLQAAVDAFQASADTEGLCPEDRILGQVLLLGYAARWDDLKLSFHTAPLVEQKVVVPVLDPAGQPDPDLVLVAVFDVVAYDEDGSTVPIEHKFTVSNIDPGGAYWGRLDLNLQASIQWIVATDAGRSVGHLLWDAIRAPQLRMYQATPLDKREFYKKAYKRADGTVAQAGDPKPGIRLEDETMDAFTARVVASVLSTPAGFFGRKVVTRDEGELDRVRLDLWGWGQQMLRARETGAYPRNLDACETVKRMQGGIECAYLPVCTGETTIDDDRVYQIRTRSQPKEFTF